MTSVAALLAAAADASSDVRQIEASLIQLAAAARRRRLAPGASSCFGGGVAAAAGAARVRAPRRRRSRGRRPASATRSPRRSSSAASQLLATQHAEPVEAASQLLLVPPSAPTSRRRQCARAAQALRGRHARGAVRPPRARRRRLRRAVGHRRRWRNCCRGLRCCSVRLGGLPPMPASAVASRVGSVAARSSPRAHLHHICHRASTAPASGARLGSSLRPRVPPREIRRRRRPNRGRAAERAAAVGGHAGGPAAAAHRRARLRAAVSGALELLFVQWLAAGRQLPRAAAEAVGALVRLLTEVQLRLLPPRLLPGWWRPSRRNATVTVCRSQLRQLRSTACSSVQPRRNSGSTACSPPAVAPAGGSARRRVVRRSRCREPSRSRDAALTRPSSVRCDALVTV